MQYRVRLPSLPSIRNIHLNINHSNKIFTFSEHAVPRSTPVEHSAKLAHCFGESFAFSKDGIGVKSAPQSTSQDKHVAVADAMELPGKRILEDSAIEDKRGSYEAMLLQRMGLIAASGFETVERPRLSGERKVRVITLDTNPLDGLYNHRKWSQKSW
jgi:hypothetical protein